MSLATVTRSILVAAAALSIGMQCQQAAATSLQVQLACASDYYAYCSKFDPEGPGVRTCMRANGARLSQRCVSALVAAGEVSKAEVHSRTPSQTARK